MSEALQRIDETLWEIPASFRPDMRVPARVFADAELLEAIRGDRSLEQLVNVATLPGIVEAALAMPDIHQGYGFPVGGLAATALPDGIVSPGGVGYDINCGVRLLALPLSEPELGPRREALVHELSRRIPAGTGRGAARPDRGLSTRCLRDGRGAAASCRGRPPDRVGGTAAGADPAAVSERAHLRGHGQVGTLGSGNHFEVQRVDEIFDPAAEASPRRGPGDRPHPPAHAGSATRSALTSSAGWTPRRPATASSSPTGSSPARRPHPRGARVPRRHGRPPTSPGRTGEAIADGVRDTIRRVLGSTWPPRRARSTTSPTTWPRSSATAAATCRPPQGRHARLPGRAEEIPAEYRAVGQLFFIPGAMGTASFVLAGGPGSMERSFGTTCHGAGRRLSRTAAKKQIGGAELRRQLEADGIVVRCASNKGLAEEAPFAYKDVERVVDVVQRAGLARRVARLVPLGVVKG